MRTKILGLVAVGLFSISPTTHAVVITISGSGSADGSWDVTTMPGRWSSPFLADQLWWGDASLAGIFANELGDLLGTPNPFIPPTFTAPPGGPFFAVDLNSGHYYGNSMVNDYSGIAGSQDTFTFAVASRLSVPEPGTLALLGLGLAGLGLSRRRRAN